MNDGSTPLTAVARQMALEAESHINLALGALACVRTELSRVEEENRDLLVEAAKRQMQFYTEREFAQLLKVSAATIARLRRTDKLQFLRVGTQIRYTSEHLALVAEVFAAGKKREVRGRRR
jgi:hypothetical protein